MVCRTAVKFLYTLVSCTAADATGAACQAASAGWVQACSKQKVLDRSPAQRSLLASSNRQFPDTQAAL